MHDLDTTALSAEIVRALRGERSREAFARRLGCSANAVYSWESGKRVPTADVLFRAADRTGHDVKVALRRFLGGSPAWLDELAPGDPALPARLVGEVRAGQPVGELSRAAGIPRFALSRWASGEATPRLPDLLAVVDAATWRGLDLVALFVDPASLPSARRAWERHSASIRIAEEHPWAHAVELALQIPEYQAGEHDDGWLADRLALPVGEVRACLELLARADVVRWEDGRWRATGSGRLHTPRASREAHLAWAARLAAQRDRVAVAGEHAWHMFLASDADVARLQDAQREYQAVVHAVASAPTGGERLVVAELRLFTIR